MYPNHRTGRVIGMAWTFCVIKKGKSIDMGIPDALPEEIEKVKKLIETVEADFEQ
jgi:hypothetical protein